MSTRSVTIYQESRTISMLLLSHANSNNNHETWYEASCWVDGITQATLQDFSSLLKVPTNEMLPTSIEVVHAWRKANIPLRSLPLQQLSPLLIRGLKHLKQASSEFGALIAQVVTRCLLTYANPVPLSLIVLEYVMCDDVHYASRHVTDLVEYAKMIAFYDRCTKSVRTKLRDQLLETTFRHADVRQTTQQSKQFSQKYFNEHCLALTQQAKHLVLAIEDDDISLRLLHYLRRTLTAAIVVSRPTLPIT